MFRSGSRKSDQAPQLARPRQPAFLTVYAPALHLRERDALEALAQQVLEGRSCEFLEAPGAAEAAAGSEFVLSLFNDPAQLDGLADAVLAARRAAQDTVLIVAVTGAQLVALGQWLQRRANDGCLDGVRLMVGADVAAIARALPGRLRKVTEGNVIRMPVAAEVENSPHLNFYVFSPELQALVARVRGFAKNGITRACLLGGPGSGKTSLAYYYYLVRGRGQFVAVNLAAENTGDKAAVKSLLCGHVSGAFPGAAARNGAFTTARDGVCFLDESHQISGAVMEVLMEALDSGQYMPFGASAKRQLECALLYASNRSWTHLQNIVNLDEFTRMGAAVLQVPELAQREEDMIAVTAATLARLASRCTDWVAPTGLSAEAWKTIRDCRWHGNIRGLIRVLESAFVDNATGPAGHLIQAPEIEQGILRWEPKTHHSYQLYEAA
jgi:DNA-binding NtrC family response regulator